MISDGCGGLQCIEFACASFRTRLGAECGLSKENAKSICSGNWIYTNVYAKGELIATYTPNGVNFHLNDWLGTRRMDTDALGSPQATYQSYPFGEPITAVQIITLPENFFTSKERDQESGLDYFGARPYASSLGHFMSPDWGGEPEPVPYVNLANPQTLNLYSYVGNNPLSANEPVGI